jgi:hypothetical protein
LRDGESYRHEPEQGNKLDTPAQTVLRCHGELQKF